MQIVTLMNQPSLLLVSVGEIQYGRHRKSMQLPHFKYSELLKGKPAWLFCIHLLLLQSRSSSAEFVLKKEKIPYAYVGFVPPSTFAGLLLMAAQ